MEAIILAGGLGTRLRCTVKDRPKPMADINGAPFLRYLVEYLSNSDINKIILSIGYKHSVIKAYFGSKYKDLYIDYVIEKEPLGTGGAIREALKLIKTDNLFIINGDTFFNVSLKELFNFHSSKNSLLTISLKKMNKFDRYGTVIIESDRVIGFKEKSYMETGYINGGIYAVNKDIGRYLDGYDSNFSFETDFLQKKYNALRIYGFISDGYFIDIGTPGDYIKAQKELKSIFGGIVG